MLSLSFQTGWGAVACVGGPALMGLLIKPPTLPNEADSNIPAGRLVSGLWVTDPAGRHAGHPYKYACAFDGYLLQTDRSIFMSCEFSPVWVAFQRDAGEWRGVRDKVLYLCAHILSIPFLPNLSFLLFLLSLLHPSLSLSVLIWNSGCFAFGWSVFEVPSLLLPVHHDGSPWQPRACVQQGERDGYQVTMGGCDWLVTYLTSPNPALHGSSHSHHSVYLLNSVYFGPVWTKRSRHLPLSCYFNSLLFVSFSFSPSCSVSWHLPLPSHLSSSVFSASLELL